MALTRRRVIGMTAAMLAGCMTSAGVARESTPIASPAATPMASPQVSRITITGKGEIASVDAKVPFEIDITADGEGRRGGFTLVGSSWGTAATYRSMTLEKVGPISTQSPQVIRIVGTAGMNGGAPAAFLLDLEDGGGEGSGQDTVSFVYGDEALPFLGEDVKLGCDCGGPGYSLRGILEAGDLVISRG